MQRKLPITDGNASAIAALEIWDKANQTEPLPCYTDSEYLINGVY
jgi:hypothetical protein